MNKPPTSPPQPPVEPNKSAEARPSVARVVLRMPEPERPAPYIAGPLTDASARQTGVAVGCALTRAGRRSEFAAFVQGDSEVVRRRTDEEILGGAPSGRTRIGAAARVMIR